MGGGSVGIRAAIVAGVHFAKPDVCIQYAGYAVINQRTAARKSAIAPEARNALLSGAQKARTARNGKLRRRETTARRLGTDSIRVFITLVVLQVSLSIGLALLWQHCRGKSTYTFV